MENKNINCWVVYSNKQKHLIELNSVENILEISNRKGKNIFGENIVFFTILLYNYRR